MNVKKTSRIAAIATVLIASSIFSTFAQKVTDLEISPYGANKIWVNAYGLDRSQDFSVNVRSSTGGLVYTEILSKSKPSDLLMKATFETFDKYKKVFDFEQLQDGKYTIEFVTSNQIISKVVNVDSNNKIKEFSAERTLALKQLIRKLEDDKYAVHFDNKMDEPTILRVYDKSGNLIYLDKGAAGEEYAKMLNFSNLEKGTYEVAINTKNHTSHYSVNL